MKKSKGCNFQELTPTGVKCPECKNGFLDPAMGRWGPFYKCTNKNCEFYLHTRPTGKKCKLKRNGKVCGHLMVEGTKTIPDRCSDKTCPNRNPHKLNKEAS
jgi:ssDNA-binding Zn-finger/Zn-ribbon topoisomerase 1